MISVEIYEREELRQAVIESQLILNKFFASSLQSRQKTLKLIASRTIYVFDAVRLTNLYWLPLVSPNFQREVLMFENSAEKIDTLNALALQESHSLGRRDILNFMKMRESQQEDDLTIGGLLIDAFTYTYAEKLPATRTDEQRIFELFSMRRRRQYGAVRVLELTNRIIGTYSLIRPQTEECQGWTSDSANLRCLAIDREFHGMGLSKLLLTDALDLASQWGVKGIDLHVQDGAVGVARLYESFGFRRDVSGDLQPPGNRLLGFHLPVTLHQAASW